MWHFNYSFAHFQIDPESDEEGDVKLDIKTRKEIKLYRCSDENGSYEILEVKSGPLDQQGGFQLLDLITTELERHMTF